MRKRIRCGRSVLQWKPARKRLCGAAARMFRRTGKRENLCGPVAETASLIRKKRAAGLSRLGMLLDMGRVPLMGATLDSAVAEADAIRFGVC